MINNIKENIDLIIKENNLKIVYNKKDWNQILYNVEFVPCEYSYGCIKYYQEWMKEQYEEFYGYLCILNDDNNKPIGLWEFQIRYEKGTYSVGSSYHEISCPIFIRNISHKKEKKYINVIIDFVFKISHYLKIDQVDLKCTSDISGLNYWYKHWKENNAKLSSIEHVLYTNLTLEKNEIWLNIRDRYKTYINKGQKKWNIEIVDYYNVSKFHLYKEYHHKIAKRVTRGELTWKMQLNALKNHEAFIILLTSKATNELIGAAYFFKSKSECIYLSGVFDRTLFVNPVSHLVQYKAIEYCKNNGLSQYRIGEKLYKQDYNEITGKELSISYFKEGFSTNIYVNFILNKHMGD